MSGIDFTKGARAAFQNNGRPVTSEAVTVVLTSISRRPATSNRTSGRDRFGQQRRQTVRDNIVLPARGSAHDGKKRSRPGRQRRPRGVTHASARRRRVAKER